MSDHRWLDIPTKSDARGCLSVIEGPEQPFPIKRIYYLHGMAGDKPRGFHAHRKLRQMAICLSGECTMVMDDGSGPESFLLEDPKKGLLVEPMVWHEMHNFSDNCVLLMIASEEYEESDYIRDADEFRELLEETSVKGPA